MSFVFGYGRHSTHKQGITEDVQREAVVRHFQYELEPQGLKWGGWLYDPAESSTLPLTERPAGRQLWALLSPGDHVVWYKIDRAFRSVIDGSRTLQLLQAKGVFVHSLDLRVDTSTPLGKFFQMVMLAVGELELDQIKARTREAILELKAQGRPYNSLVPIGYRRVAKTLGKKGTGRIDPCPQERELVKKIHEITHKWSHERTWRWVMNQIKYSGLHTQRKWQKKTISWALLALAYDFPKIFTYDELKDYAKANPKLRDATVRLPAPLSSLLFGGQRPVRGQADPA